MSGLRKHDTVSKVVAGDSVLKLRKNHILFDLCKNSFIIKKNSQEIVDLQLQRVKTGGSLEGNAHFGASNSQAGGSFLRFVWHGPCFRSVGKVDRVARIARSFGQESPREVL